MEIPKVGIGVIVFKDKKILLGKRRNTHGDGEWALVGGKLDYLESIESCAKREIMEESGMEIHHPSLVTVVNSIKYAPKHFICIGMEAEWKSGEPQVFAHEKIEEWGWFDIDNLPQPMFHDSHQVIRAYKNGAGLVDIDVFEY